VIISLTSLINQNIQSESELNKGSELSLSTCYKNHTSLIDDQLYIVQYKEVTINLPLKKYPLVLVQMRLPNKSSVFSTYQNKPIFQSVDKYFIK